MTDFLFEFKLNFTGFSDEIALHDAGVDAKKFDKLGRGIPFLRYAKFLKSQYQCFVG